jgi:L-lactate utilization protein LutB
MDLYNNNMYSESETEGENQFLNTDFPAKVKEYVTLDEQITRLNQLIKERRKRMKELSSDIMVQMSQNHIDYVNIKNGVLVYNEKEGFKGLSKKVMEAGLTNFFQNDAERATEAIETIMNTREKVVKTSLKLKRF